MHLFSKGTLSGSTFDADLDAAIGEEELFGHHAVLFAPDAGGLADRTFLIIDLNDLGGYQAGSDLVIELVDGVHLHGLDESNFV